MPPPGHLQKKYPGKTHLLKHAAEWGQLIIVRCNGCRRSATYLAADLVELLDPERPALWPPFPCPRCKTDEYIRVTLNSPYGEDYGRMLIRRPGPVRVTQTWRTVKLGDP